MSEISPSRLIVGKHFTIHGSEVEGWSLNVYNRDAGGAVSPDWREPKLFKTLKDLLNELVELEEVST